MTQSPPEIFGNAYRKHLISKCPNNEYAVPDLVENPFDNKRLQIRIANGESNDNTGITIRFDVTDKNKKLKKWDCMLLLIPTSKILKAAYQHF